MIWQLKCTGFSRKSWGGSYLTGGGDFSDFCWKLARGGPILGTPLGGGSDFLGTFLWCGFCKVLGLIVTLSSVILFIGTQTKDFLRSCRGEWSPEAPPYPVGSHVCILKAGNLVAGWSYTGLGTLGGRWRWLFEEGCHRRGGGHMQTQLCRKTSRVNSLLGAEKLSAEPFNVCDLQKKKMQEKGRLDVGGLWKVTENRGTRGNCGKFILECKHFLWRRLRKELTSSWFFLIFETCMRCARHPHFLPKKQTKKEQFFETLGTILIQNEVVGHIIETDKNLTKKLAPSENLVQKAEFFQLKSVASRTGK